VMHDDIPCSSSHTNEALRLKAARSLALLSGESETMYSIALSFAASAPSMSPYSGMPAACVEPAGHTT